MCGQVRFDISDKKICFDVLLVDLKMTTSSDVSAAHCDVHHVSVMSLSIRLCQPISPKA
jgi:hypothetical protein